MPQSPLAGRQQAGTRTIVVLSKPTPAAGGRQQQQQQQRFYTIRQPVRLRTVEPAGVQAPMPAKRPLAAISPPASVGKPTLAPSPWRDRRDYDELEPPLRKRERLTHLSSDEKMYRRKLKNRIAAQTARDRKKVANAEMEHTLTQLERDYAALAADNEQLRAHNELLAGENDKLRRQLEQKHIDTEAQTPKQEPDTITGSPTAQQPEQRSPRGALESAALISVPQQRDQAPPAAAAALLALVAAVLGLATTGPAQRKATPATKRRTTSCSAYSTSSYGAPRLSNSLARLANVDKSSLCRLVSRLPTADRRRLASLLWRRVPPDRTATTTAAPAVAVH